MGVCPILMHSCVGYVTLLLHSGLFVPKVISGQGLLVDIFSSPVEFPFYALPVGFTIDKHWVFHCKKVML